MLEDTATTEESTTNEETEIDEPVLSTHPYDLPGEWFVLNAQSGHEKKVKTRSRFLIFSRFKFRGYVFICLCSFCNSYGPKSLF